MTSTKRAKRKPAVAARVQVRGKAWKKSRSIAAEKYQPVTRAILASLTRKPMAFTELVARVTPRLPGFSGSIPWYTITCLRELEVRGKVVRQSAPVRYLRP